MAKSRLEDVFKLKYLPPKWKREYKFHPTRKWKFDFANPAIMVAVEIEGGAFSGGRHTRGVGFVNDCEKYNTATAMGWRVFRYATVEQMRDFNEHMMTLKNENRQV